MKTALACSVLVGLGSIAWAARTSSPPAPIAETRSPEKRALGERLFFDASLSEPPGQSCATCHDPQHGYSGHMDTSDGGEKQPLRTPALVNLAWAKRFGWDGNVAALPPFLQAHLVRELASELPPATALYAAYNAKLGGDQPWIGALTAFVLTRYMGDSEWDRCERLPDRPKDLEAGYKLFVGKAGCAHCHPPPLYTDGAVHDGWLTEAVRGAALRPALLHDGSATLDTLLDHHGDAKLSAVEKSALVAFTKAL